MRNYRPIACALHEQYQIAVIKQAWLDLCWIDNQGNEQMGRIKPKDVYTRNKAEYLLAENAAIGEFEIRLDAIRKANWAKNGKRLLAG